MAVTMTVGGCFRCQNPGCGCEIDVTNASGDAESNRRCSCCGSAMKKRYRKPVLKIIDAESEKHAHLFEVEASALPRGPRIYVWRCPSKRSTSSSAT
jgi:hypothetical protein